VIGAAVANVFGDRWMYLQVQGYFWVVSAFVARATQLQEEAQSDDSAEPGELDPLLAPQPALAAASEATA
jgi:hypothetical protein